MAQTYRNWIERELKRTIAKSPIYVGERNGKKCYEVMFLDFTTKDYYIDFDNYVIEEV